ELQEDLGGPATRGVGQLEPHQRGPDGRLVHRLGRLLDGSDRNVTHAKDVDRIMRPMTRLCAAVVLSAFGVAAGAAGEGPPPRSEATQTARPRARDIGLNPGLLPPGPLNAITDVSGVRVGHATLVEGDDVRTGVTVIVPHPGNVFQEKVPGAVFV